MIDTSNRMLYRLDMLNEQNNTVSYQLSSGLELEKGSDDSVLFAQITGIEDDINVYEGIENQIDKTLTFNSSSDSTVASIKLYFESVKSEILTALNDTVDDSTRDAMSANLENTKESLFDLVNEDTAGMYLFAGADTTVEPFVMDDDGNVSYVGSNELKTTLVDKGLYKEQGVTGYDIMYYTKDSADTGEDLTFDLGDTLLDSDGNTWQFIDYDEDGVVDYDKVYLNGLTSGANAISNPSASLTSMDVTINTGSSPVNYTLSNVSSNEVEAKESYFDILDDLINALALVNEDGDAVQSSAASQVLSDSLQRLDDSFDSINKSHAVLGGKNESFENYSTLAASKITNYSIFYSEYAAADLTEAALKAQSLETTFAALYSTISKINSMSLSDYI